jgi:hypothetical protein
MGSIADAALIMIDALSAEANAASARDRPAKRTRLNPKQGIKHDATSSTPGTQESSKRVKVTKNMSQIPRAG